MIISFTITYISVKYNPRKILLFQYWVWVLNIKTDDLAHAELTSNHCFIVRFVCVYSQRDIRICWKKFAVYNFYWYLEQFTERKMLASINWPGRSWFHFSMIKCWMSPLNHIIIWYHNIVIYLKILPKHLIPNWSLRYTRL